MFDHSENEIIQDMDIGQRNTDWYNPTKDTVILELHEATPNGPEPVRNPAKTGRPLNYRERTGKMKYIIKPGETLTISSRFDSAIQVVRDGVIQSGLAPQLVNRGSKDAPVVSPAKMHSALNSAEQEKKSAQNEAAVAMRKAAEADAKLAEVMAELERIKKQQAEKAADELSSASDTSTTSNETGRFVPPPKKKD